MLGVEQDEELVLMQLIILFQHGYNLDGFSKENKSNALNETCVSRYWCQIWKPGQLIIYLLQ